MTLRLITLLREFPARYKISPPLLGLIAGILSGGHIDNVWLAVVIVSPAAGVLSLLVPCLRFLLFVPIGLLFSAGPFLSSGTDITAFTGRKIDLEGTVYRSAEKTGY